MDEVARNELYRFDRFNFFYERRPESHSPESLRSFLSNLADPFSVATLLGYYFTNQQERGTFSILTSRSTFNA